NLDTSAAFLTPVLVLAARRRGVGEGPFLYGALVMSNSASLLLPGSNLTNLLVLANEHAQGTQFAARMLPAWAASVVVTAAFVAVAFRSELRGRASSTAAAGPDPTSQSPSAVPVGPEVGGAARGAAGGAVGPWAVLSGAAVAAAVVLMLAAGSPAPGVVAVGAVVAAIAVWRRAAAPREVWDAVEPLSLAGVFGIAVALGALARSWAGPAHLMAHAGAVATAALGAGAAVAVNNLPAAVLLGSRHPAHARALLLGLNLGPNLAVTGSLSALIWWRAARTVGAQPSARRLSRLGVVLVPVSIAASAAALWLVSPGRL
ncbi:MAG TPA: SLC13 family permease, partial [Acidimicrobiales bacterium]|nr:SLC13 family permease [Acidimicrobiales bacterium]